MIAFNRLTNLSWPTLLTGVFPRLGLPTTTARVCALEMATLRRCLSNRKSSPLGDSLASLAHMLKNTMGASWPWNLSTLPTFACSPNAARSLLTWWLYGATNISPQLIGRVTCTDALMSRADEPAGETPGELFPVWKVLPIKSLASALITATSSSEAWVLPWCSTGTNKSPASMSSGPL